MNKTIFFDIENLFLSTFSVLKLVFSKFLILFNSQIISIFSKHLNQIQFINGFNYVLLLRASYVLTITELLKKFSTIKLKLKSRSKELSQEKNKNLN
jgi:hypothetical protein